MLERRMGRLEIPFNKLGDMLGITDDSRIVNLEVPYNMINVLSVYVTSPNLEEVVEGGMCPRVTLEEISGFDN